MLIMYSTLGCHLCDDAMQALLAAGVREQEIDIVDIAEDPSLMERYCTKIPVVRDKHSSSELCWPFNAEDVVTWWNSLP